MLGLVKSLNADHIRPYLEKEQLQIEPDQWYPIQTILNVFNAVAEDGQNVVDDFVGVRMAVAQNSPYPPEFKDLPFEEVMIRWDKVYQSVHRGGDAGEMPAELVAPGHIQIKARTPYPDDFIYGGIYGRTRLFLPANIHFKVYYDPDLPRHDNGAEFTVIHVKWDV